MSRHELITVIAALGVATLATPASAQVLGSFPWQMQPYCNIVTLTLTTAPAGFTLDGTDDQCGATNKASAVGVASFNQSGNVTLNFTIVTAPAGKPVHVSAVVSPANGAGTWTDSVGNTGTFAFFSSTPGLPARPLPASGLPASIITTTEIAAGAVGASDINTAEVQARISGTCVTGQSVVGVNANGSVICAVGGIPPAIGTKSDPLSLTTTEVAAFDPVVVVCPASAATCTARIEVSSQFSNLSGGNAAQMRVAVDGSGSNILPSSVVNVNSAATTSTSTVSTFSFVRTGLAPGAHQFDVTFRTSSGTGSAGFRTLTVELFTP